MLKLTVNPETQPRSLIFDQPSITIGKGFPPAVDFPLTDEGIEETHVTITQSEERFTIVNVANDPFVSLNGLPFRKKTLKQGDVLQIRETIIRFDGLLQKVQLPIVQEEVEIEEPPTSSTVTPQVVEPEPEKIAIPPAAVEFQPVPPPAAVIPTPKKEHSVRHRPEPRQHKSKTPAQEEELINTNIRDSAEPLKPRFKYFKQLFAVLGICFVVGCIGLFITYNKISANSNQERLIAAEGVADVAMALAYAQVHHIKPQKQNWMDPEFLTNNLASILSSEYSSFANIDHQGQFRNCPYILRVYTNPDLSHFVVIAQPNPSLLQWIIPHSAIVMDSQAMEIRDVYDIKALNRLLVNYSTLDGSSAQDIFQTVKQGEIIPLISFGTKKGFVPPKTLALIRPGAENRVYNAPRYYQFGEAMLKKTLTLLQNNSNGLEITRLQQQLQELAKFPDLVMFSSLGIQKAMQFQKALIALSPRQTFLSGYLTFDSEGLISSSHLLFDSDIPSISNFPLKDISLQSSDVALEPSIRVENTTPHPLQLQLMTLAKKRQQSLAIVTESIIALLNRHKQEAVADFSKEFQQLVTSYNEIDAEYNNKVVVQLAELYQEHAAMPLSEFTSFIKAAGLEKISKADLKQKSRELEKGELQQNSDIIGAKIEQISQVSSFDQLNQAVSEVATMLNLTQFPSPKRLMGHQNQLRIQTIRKINEFLLSPNSPVSSTVFTEDNRSVLSNILKTAWITDPNTVNYYITEYEHLLNH
ncbi:MAG: FHA domain-containing protein [Parachlamydiaceae bacterium]|nr:FHA domain-containing protein [Parachlamydiaceae bacterium]